MRKFIKVTQTEIEMSSEDEHAELLRLIRDRAPIPTREKHGQRLAAGTVVEAISDYGDLMMGQLAITVADAYPNAENCYLVWFLNGKCELARMYVHQNVIKVWTPPPESVSKPKKPHRRLKLDETADG